MSGISGVGITPTLPSNVTQALETDSTSEANALATLYALSFAGGNTAAAIGLTSPKNFGDVEAILAEISAKLDLTKSEAETSANLSEVEKSRSETMGHARLLGSLAGNLEAQLSLNDDVSSLASQISNWAGDAFGLASLQSDYDATSFQLTAMTALVLASTGNSIGNLNQALEMRNDTLHDPVAAKGVEENGDTEQVIEEAVEDPAKQEEMLQEQQRIRERLLEAGLNAEAANRVAGVGAALTAGIATLLATIERLTGDAALFAEAVGAPQGDQRVKVTI